MGSGVFGPVFRAHDDERDRLVAVKVFRLDLTPEQADEVGDDLQALVAALAERDARARPPACAPGVEQGTPWLAQEFAARRRSRGDPPPPDAARRSTRSSASSRRSPMRSTRRGRDGWTPRRAAPARHPRDAGPRRDRHHGRRRSRRSSSASGFRAPRRRPYMAPGARGRAGWDTRADVYSLAVITLEMIGTRRASSGGHLPRVDGARRGRPRHRTLVTCPDAGPGRGSGAALRDRACVRRGARRGLFVRGAARRACRSRIAEDTSRRRPRPRVPPRERQPALAGDADARARRWRADDQPARSSHDGRARRVRRFDTPTPARPEADAGWRHCSTIRLRSPTAPATCRVDRGVASPVAHAARSTRSPRRRGRAATTGTAGCAAIAAVRAGATVHADAPVRAARRDARASGWLHRLPGGRVVHARAAPSPRHSSPRTALGGRRGEGRRRRTNRSCQNDVVAAGGARRPGASVAGRRRHRRRRRASSAAAPPPDVIAAASPTPGRPAHHLVAQRARASRSTAGPAARRRWRCATSTLGTLSRWRCRARVRPESPRA